MLELNHQQVKRREGSRLSKRANHLVGEPAMLKLTIQMLGNVCLFHCAGRVVANDEHFLRVAVRSQSGIQTVILDLAEVSAIDAAGVGMLVELRERAKATRRELKLMNLTPRVEEVLRLTNLMAVFEVCSVREMMDLLCSTAQLGQPTTVEPLPIAS